MSERFFFGYGSLVNRQTHGFGRAMRAEASGWRRAWRYTDQRQVAYLTAVPDPDCTILGLIAAVPDQDWSALDLREAAYDRLAADHAVRHDGPADAKVAIYAIPQADLRLPDADHPVLLSYIDVVIGGYLSEFGAGADRHFLETTDGWDAPILDDRADPLYPRHQPLSEATRDAVDGLLRTVGAKVLAR